VIVLIRGIVTFVDIIISAATGYYEGKTTKRSVLMNGRTVLGIKTVPRTCFRRECKRICTRMTVG